MIISLHTPGCHFFLSEWQTFPFWNCQSSLRGAVLRITSSGANKMILILQKFDICFLIKPSGPCCLLCFPCSCWQRRWWWWGVDFKTFHHWAWKAEAVSVTGSGLQTLLPLPTGDIPFYQVGKYAGYPLPTKKQENPSRVAFNLTKAVTRMILEEHPNQINCLLACNMPEIVIIKAGCLSICCRFIKAHQT